MKVIITFTFCCDNLRKSKFMALEKPGNSGNFFSPTLWPGNFFRLLCGQGIFFAYFVATLPGNGKPWEW